MILLPLYRLGGQGWERIPREFSSLAAALDWLDPFVFIPVVDSWADVVRWFDALDLGEEL
jgi:hypothetical protein